MTPRWVRRAGVLGTGLVFAALATLASAGPAVAHDVLISTSPRDGATLAQPPDHVVLTFNEPVQGVGAGVTVTGPDGKEFQQGPPSVVDATVTQALSPPAAPGRYVVAYRVVSADGHPVSDRVTFTLTPTAASAPSAAGPSASTVRPQRSVAAAEQVATASAPVGSSTGVGAATGLVLLLLVAGGAVTLARSRRDPGSHDEPPTP